MTLPQVLMLGVMVVVGIAASTRLRRTDLSPPGLLLGWGGLSLLLGVVAVTLWTLWPEHGGLFIGVALMSGVSTVSRLTETRSVRALSRPARWAVCGTAALLPGLGLTLAVAALRPQMWDRTVALLPSLLALVVGTGAALALLGGLWHGLERHWILPAKVPPNVASPATDTPPIFLKRNAQNSVGPDEGTGRS